MSLNDDGIADDAPPPPTVRRFAIVESYCRLCKHTDSATTIVTLQEAIATHDAAHRDAGHRAPKRGVFTAHFGRTATGRCNG